MTSTALVLGSGGVTGVAWEIGLLAGLADHGVDLTGAELVIGTSAGAVVGALITADASLRELYAGQLAPPVGEVGAKLGAGTLLRWGRAAAGPWDAARTRARIGQMALAAKTMPEARRRELLAANLPAHEWPRQRFLVTAVDAGSGEFTAFDAGSGVGLVDAVAASCAVPGIWPPVTIGNRRWVDGGVRSAVNADLAAGCDAIVVLAPIPYGFGPMPSLRAQVAELEKHARVVVVSPDQQTRRAIGLRMLDPVRRVPAARGGHAQAAAVASDVAAVWTGTTPR